MFVSKVTLARGNLVYVKLRKFSLEASQVRSRSPAVPCSPAGVHHFFGNEGNHAYIKLRKFSSEASEVALPERHQA
jgi:hypothetical protein